jgi:hypothetical protein
MPEQPAIIATLEKAIEGLEMPSETDAPFQTVWYPLEKAALDGLTPEASAQLAGAPEGAKIETRSLHAFFEDAAGIEDWMNDDEKTSAKRFAELRDTLKNSLEKPQVLLWGDAAKQVLIAGAVEGGLAGLTTKVVET